MAGMRAEDALQQAKAYVKKTVIGMGAIQGQKGDKGDPGTTYTPVIGTVRTVDNLTDAAASVTVNATTKKATFNFDIPQGLRGIQGEQGIQGIQGEKGDIYTPQIGDVLTVNNTSEASATVILDDVNKKATFNFSIPKGETGAKGDKGEQGEKGDTGLQGVQGLQGEKGEQGEQGVQGIQGIKGDKGDDGYPFLIYKQYEVGIEEFDEADYPEIGLMFMVHVWEDDKGYPVYRYTGDGTATPYSLVTYMNTEGIKGEKGDKGDQGEQGVQGESGADGITFTPEIGIVNTVDSTTDASVTIEVKADEGRAIYNFDIPKGADGTIGRDGTDGIDGVSPTIEVVPTDTGHTIKMTDKEGVHSFDVNNGLNGSDGANGIDGINGNDGADGFSPVITVTETDGGHNVAIEDVNGVQNFEVLDGTRAYTSLEQLGLTADVTLDEVISTMPKGSSAILSVTEFTNAQTMFPYEEGNDYTFGRVYIVKGNDNGRTYVKWFRKDGAKEYIAKIDITTNAMVGWKPIFTNYYTSLAQLGLTAPVSIGEAFNAMPDKSTLMLNVEAIVDDGNIQTVTDVPKDYGILTIEKHTSGRHRIEYSSSLGGSSSDVRKWIGSIKGNDGTGLRWIELTGSAKIYTTMAQLGLDGATATIQDVIDAISVGEIAMLRSDAFNNNNWQTQCNGIQYGYLKIEKTMNNLSNIELQEVVAPNRRYFGTQASGKFAGWTQATNTRGLISNAQNFKIDLTKNNLAWYGMFTFNFVYGTTPCEITVAITDKVYYTITKGLNLVSALTYTQDGANYTIGIDLTAKVYGTQVVDMPREFGVVNSLTAEKFEGATSAILKGFNFRTYTQLSEMGLDSSVTLNDVIQWLSAGQSALLNTKEFVNYKTLFPYNEENDQYAMVHIFRSYNNIRNYAIWYRADGSKMAISKISDNKVVGWQEIAKKSIYNSVAELNRAKGTNIELVNGEDNTQKIVDALSTGEQFVSLYHNNANQNRFGIDVSYGNLIHEIRITKCLDADLTANYATVTAFMNTGCVMSRIYYKTYSTDWSSSKDYVESLLANS